MSFVTYAELLKGAEGSDRRREVLRRLEGPVRQVPVDFEVAPKLCEHYAAQSARLRTGGTPIGGNDLWIAAHALAQGATLVTNNVMEFPRIADLAALGRRATMGAPGWRNKIADPESGSLFE